MFTSSAMKRNRLLFSNKMAPAASFHSTRIPHIPHSSSSGWRRSNCRLGLIVTLIAQDPKFLLLDVTWCAAPKNSNSLNERSQWAARRRSRDPPFSHRLAAWWIVVTWCRVGWWTSDQLESSAVIGLNLTLIWIKINCNLQCQRRGEEHSDRGTRPFWRGTETTKAVRFPRCSPPARSWLAADSKSRPPGGRCPNWILTMTIALSLTLAVPTTSTETQKTDTLSATLPYRCLNCVGSREFTGWTLVQIVTDAKERR